MSLLTIIQAMCARTNVPSPTSVMGQISDTQVAQMVRLLEEEGNDLSKRGSWQGLTREATWTTTAAEDQGALTTLASNGFNYIKNGTFWDRTNKLPIGGPLDDGQWAAIKGRGTTGPRYYYRIRGDHLLIVPTPAASLSWAFEYASENWILANDGTTYKSAFTLDTDTVLIPEPLMLMGLRWRWKKEKGLEYAEDFRTYEQQVKDALGRDGGKSVLSMAGEKRDAMPGILVPAMSWPIP